MDEPWLISAEPKGGPQALPAFERQIGVTLPVAQPFNLAASKQLAGSLANLNTLAASRNEGLEGATASIVTAEDVVNAARSFGALLQSQLGCERLVHGEFSVARVEARGEALEIPWELLWAVDGKMCAGLYRDTACAGPPGRHGRSADEVLFAWGGETAENRVTPAREHLDAIKCVLAPLGVNVRCLGEGSGAAQLLAPGRVDQLRRAIASGTYSTLHLVAHGRVFDDNKNELREPQMHLGGAWVSPTQLADAIVCPLDSSPGSSTTKLRMVVLAACSAANPGLPRSWIESIALELHRRGVETVVAWRWPVSQEGARDFTAGFYRRLTHDLQPVWKAVAGAAEWLPAADRVGLQVFAHDADARPITVPPFCGLDSFGRARGKLFVGRDREIAEAVIKIRDSLPPSGEGAIMAILAPSGTGKSSFLNAGILPNLTATELSQIHTCDPLDSVVIGSQEDAQRRLDDLAKASDGQLVVATLRVDLLDETANLTWRGKNLRDLLVAHAYVLPQMTSEALGLVVRLPLKRVGVSWEEPFADKVLAEARVAADPLPVLQFALEQSWVGRDGDHLRSSDAKSVPHLLAAAADEAVAKASLAAGAGDSSGARRRALWTLLARLMAPTAIPGTWIRRPCPTRDLTENERTVAESLLGARILRATVVGDGAAYELGHDVLLRAWPQCREVCSARDGLVEFAEAARRWHDGGRRTGGYWTALAHLAEWTASAPAAPLLPHEEAFLERLLRARRAVWASGAAGALLTIGLIAAAAWGAAREYDHAQRDYCEAGVATASRLAASDPAIASLIASTVVREKPGRCTGSISTASMSDLRQLAWNLSAATLPTVLLSGGGGPASGVAWSRDGAALALVTDSDVTTWDAARGVRSGFVQGGGDYLAVPTGDGDAVAWTSGTALKVARGLRGDGATIQSVDLAVAQSDRRSAGETTCQYPLSWGLRPTWIDISGLADTVLLEDDPEWMETAATFTSALWRWRPLTGELSCVQSAAVAADGDRLNAIDGSTFGRIASYGSIVGNSGDVAGAFNASGSILIEQAGPEVRKYSIKDGAVGEIGRYQLSLSPDNTGMVRTPGTTDEEWARGVRRQAYLRSHPFSWMTVSAHGLLFALKKQTAVEVHGASGAAPVYVPTRVWPGDSALADTGVATVGDGALSFHAVPSSDLSWTSSGPWTSGITLDPEGERIAVPRTDGRVGIFTVARRVANAVSGSAGGWNLDQRLSLIGSHTVLPRWDGGSFSIGKSGAFVLQVLPQSRINTTQAGAKTVLRVVSLRTHAERHISVPTGCRWRISPSGSRVLLFCGDGQISIEDLETGGRRALGSDLSNSQYVAFTTDDDAILAADDDELSSWDISGVPRRIATSPRPRTLRGEGNAAWFAYEPAVNRSGNLVSIQGENGATAFLSLPDLSTVSAPARGRHCEMAPDRAIACRSDGGEFEVRDATASSEWREYRFAGPPAATDWAIGPNGLLALAGESGVTLTSKDSAHVESWPGLSRCGEFGFSANGRWVTTKCGDYRSRVSYVLDASNGRLSAPLPMYAQWISSDGATAIGMSSAGQLYSMSVWGTDVRALGGFAPPAGAELADISTSVASEEALGVPTWTLDSTGKGPNVAFGFRSEGGWTFDILRLARRGVDVAAALQQFPTDADDWSLSVRDEPGLALIGRAGQLAVLNTRTGVIVKGWPTDVVYPLLAPDGATFVGGTRGQHGVDAPTDYGLYSADDGHKIGAIKRPRHAPYVEGDSVPVTYSPDGHYVAALVDDAPHCQLNIYDARTADLVAAFEDADYGAGIGPVFSRELGGYLWSCVGHGRSLYNVSSPDEKGRRLLFDGAGDSEFLAVSQDESVLIRVASSGRLQAVHVSGDHVSASELQGSESLDLRRYSGGARDDVVVSGASMRVVVSRAGEWVAVISGDGRVRIWGGQRSGLAEDLPTADEDPIVALRFSADEDWAVTVTRSGALAQWPLAVARVAEVLGSAAPLGCLTSSERSMLLGESASDAREGEVGCLRRVPRIEP